MHNKCRFFPDPVLLQRLAALWLVALLAGCAGGVARAPDTMQVPPLDNRHRQEVVMLALGLADSPYRYGGTDPQRGFDCSGLVNYVFQVAAGAQLPRTSSHQASVSRRIDRRELREGDLVFFNTLSRPNSHVGIYIGDNRFVNAPSSGGRVRIDSLDNPYFAKRFDSARTLFARR